MRDIAELNILIREEIKIPPGLTISTAEFREGWKFVRAVNVQILEKKIHQCGWNFIRHSDASLRSGVGDTSQEAIGNALRMALRHVSTHFHAVEVEHIELSEYPWFFLARVRVYPYRVQTESVLSVSDQSLPTPTLARQRRLPLSSAALYPHFGSAMPLLKQILTISQNVPQGQQFPS